MASKENPKTNKGAFKAPSFEEEDLVDQEYMAFLQAYSCTSFSRLPEDKTMTVAYLVASRLLDEPSSKTTKKDEGEPFGSKPSKK